MITFGHVVAIMILSLTYSPLAMAQNASPLLQSQSDNLTAAEAEILVYFAPAAKRVRAAGLDVFMEAMTSDAYNQASYFFFQMFSTRRCKACSANVGFYAVNKHTGDVRSLDESQGYPSLTNKEIAGIQRILRVSHHIDADTIRRYRDETVLPDSAQ